MQKLVISIPVVFVATFLTTALWWSTPCRADLGPNLIPNPSVETAGSNGLPVSWFKGGYGTNTRVLTYPVSDSNSVRAVKVDISSYSSGDAKWWFNHVPVVPGKTYQFSDFYISNIPNIVTVQFKMADGTFSYKDIGNLAATASFTQASGQFVVPANVTSAMVFHLINQVGELQEKR